MISQEKIYRLLQTQNWKDLIDVFYKNKDFIKTDSLLSQSFETALIVINEKAVKLDVEVDYIDCLESILMLDSGKFIRISESQKEVITIAIANGKRDNIQYSYQYAKIYPDNEVCKKIIEEYKKKEPEKFLHSQMHNLAVTENKEIDESHDYRKPLFNSLQEVEFFLALKRVFDSYQIYPNVGLSSILDFDKIKSGLTEKEIDFFLKSSVDFVVLEPFSNYFPIYFFEIDSIWHDSDVQKEKDETKDKIFSLAGQKLFRIRKINDTMSEDEFEKLIVEIRDKTK